MFSCVTALSVTFVSKNSVFKSVKEPSPCAASLTASAKHIPPCHHSRYSHKNYLVTFAVCEPCFLKMRVGENSPSLWPTMFSVTKTELKILPLCTRNVWPTKSGVTVERRDQVLIGFFVPGVHLVDLLEKMEVNKRTFF